MVMSKKTTNEAENKAVSTEAIPEAAPNSNPQEPKATNSALYPFEDFYAHPEVIGSTKDMVWAAFHYNGVVGAATKEQARMLVKEFAERKVES